MFVSKQLSEKRFKKYLNCVIKNLKQYINRENLKIDYICPILRSGAIPAVHIASELNIIKFIPFQIKHIQYKSGERKNELLLNSLKCIEIKKTNPVFLVVDSNQYNGDSAKKCIDLLKERYPNSKILFVTIAKKYGSQSFIKDVVYEDAGYYYNGDNGFTKKYCKENQIDYYVPIFHWESMEVEKSQIEDLAENVYF